MPRRASYYQATPVEQDVLTLARERMAYLFETFDHVAVSFSGGKDSTVCLNLALEQARSRNRLPLRVIHFDEEAIPYETEEYVRRVAESPDVALEWYCLPIRHRNACSKESPEWYPWDPTIPEKWVRPMPPEAITELAGFAIDPETGWRRSIPECLPLLFPDRLYPSAVCVLGIRADESMTRRAAVLGRKNENYIIATNDVHGHAGLKKAYPIYDWTGPDVWTAPNELGWDYNRAYDVMEMAGVSRDDQRCAPPFGEEPAQNLWIFAHCFPDIWDRMYDRVPGAAAGARYSRTELWAFGAKPGSLKGDDETYEAAIRRHLLGFEPATRAKVAKAINAYIRLHYKKTAEPILPHAKHPESGISWDFLLMLAVRGDLKNRRRPSATPPGSPERVRAREKYTAALHAHLHDKERF